MSRALPEPVTDGVFSPLHSQKLLTRWLEKGRFAFTSYGLEKRCSKCGDMWPADTEFFHSDKGTGDQLFAWCVACVQENRIARRAAARSATSEVAS